MIVGQHIQWNTLCDAPNLHSILNKKLDDFIIATDPTYGTGELTYYYQVDYYNSDIIISVYEYIDGCFVKINSCGYNNNRVQTVSLVTPTNETPQTETCCTQQSLIQCVPQQPTIPIPSATNDHTKLINKNADANFQHVTLAEKDKWNSQTTDVLGTVLTGLTEATTKVNLEATDTVLGAFGKIKKWFSSLKALAFLDKVDYIKDIDNIPTDLVQDANYVHTDNNYTNTDAQIVANTSGTNTGDQDLTPYLLKDTTLQTADTPEDTSLFSFWKIGVGRVKIAFSELITNVMHSQLRGLDWLGSGHTGTANTIAGFDGTGASKEYALTDFGGAKRLELKKTIALGGYTATSIAIRQTSDSIKIAICGTNITRILTLSLDLKTISHTASVVTDGSLVEYIENIDEFWIIQDTGNLIYRISADTNLLIGTFATSTATVARQNFFYYKGFVYSSALDTTKVLRINSLDRSFTVTQLSVYNVRKIIAFEHQGIDYVYANTNSGTNAMDMNLNIYPITSIPTNALSSIVYLNNKLYLVGADGRGKSLDLTNWPITSSCPINDEVIVFFDQIKDSDNYLLLQRNGFGNVLIKTDFSDIISSTNMGIIPKWTTNSYPDAQLKIHSPSQFIFILNYSSFFYLTIYKYE